LNNNDLSDNIDDSSSVFSYSTEDSPWLKHPDQNEKARNGEGFETIRNNVTNSA
jgi:hypothetical protein